MTEKENAEVKKIEKVLVAEEVPKIKIEPALERWIPKTSIGKKVFSGEITDIDEILKSGKKIYESEIVDKLVPNLKNEIILIGGRTGKGGGIQRIPVKITAKMHRSGRRFTTSAFVVVGNEDGLVGIGKGAALEARDAIAKANQRAKVNIIRIKRGCGSWECGCDTGHSIPFKTKGKSGSVKVVLSPAPKGIGIVTDDESKKILRLAGIKDVWIKTFGNTSTRMNLITAIYDALKKMYIYDRKETVE
jgi:small subunit ribosomal protein S5